MTSLDAALRQVVAATAVAKARWWIVGSAAVLLHGARTGVADLDLLCADADDARALIAMLGGEVLVGSGTDLFRSAVFGRCDTTPLAIEVMAGLAVRGESVRLETREWREFGGIAAPVPSRAELIALLRRFGRAKDLARAALLER